MGEVGGPGAREILLLGGCVGALVAFPLLGVVAMVLSARQSSGSGQGVTTIAVMLAGGLVALLCLIAAGAALLLAT